MCRWTFASVRATFLKNNDTTDRHHLPSRRRTFGEKDFLTLPETLVFFVGARSGSCAGAPGCQNGQWNGNATTGMATLRRDGFDLSHSLGDA